MHKCMGLSPKRNRRLEREKEQEKRGLLIDGNVFEERRVWRQESQVEALGLRTI